MSTSPTAHLRILLVEDSPNDAQLIMRQLKQDGLEAEHKRVENEADFIGALSWTPDLILSDYSLPHFSGQQALQIVKQYGLDIAFILVSGSVGEDTIVDLIKQGADDYVMKDRLTRLSSAILNTLEQKRLRKEKKHTDEALRVSEELLNLFFTQSLDGFFFMMLDEPVRWDDTVDKEKVLEYFFTHQRITKINDAMLRQYRAKPGQFIGLTPRDLFAHDPEEGKRMFRELLNTGHVELKSNERRIDGTQMWVEGDYVCLRDSEGRLTGHFGIQRDVTERVQAEENLRKAEVKFRTLAERIPPIIYIAKLDHHMGVTYVSPRIETLGFTQEEWIADPELWFRQIHPEDQDKVKADIEQSARTGSPFKSEYRIMARDGSMRWLIDEAIDVTDNDDTPLYRQGFMLDITERKNAEESLVSREQFMELLNDMTRTILLSSEYDVTMQIIASDMRKIIGADDCYIMRWNDETKLPIPVTTTAELEVPFSEAPLLPEEISITASLLRVGHVVAIDDVYKSPYINAEAVRYYPAKSIIGIPLIAGEHKLGVVVIAFNSSHTFTQEEVDRAKQAGNQVALALLQFQQNFEIQRRLKESNTLTSISHALSETERVGLDKVLQLIVDSALGLIHQADESVIHLMDAEKKTLIPRAIAGFDKGTKASDRPSIGLKEGVAGRVIETGETINIDDINASDLYIHKQNAPTYCSLLVAPVHSGELRIGTISVQSTMQNAFSASDIQLLNALSVQAAIAIENTRLFETTQQSLKEVNALYRTGQGLASSLNADELIGDVVNLLHENFDYYHVQIYLLDPANQDAVLKGGSGDVGARMMAEKFRLPRGTGITNHVIDTGLPFVTNDVNAIVFFSRNALLPDTQSEMTVPIKVEGNVMGVIDIQERPPKKLTDNDLQLLSAVADQLSVALQRANLYANLQTALQQEQTVRSQLVQSERLALVGRLLASVSHELNNPLQAIQNALFLLKEEENLSMQGKQDLDVVISETERMAALIERLRSAYRPGRIRDFRPVNINDLIEDVHMLISTHMRHKQIVFEFFPDPDLPPISGMSDQMRQVILNLFINAIEVMQPGGRLLISTRSLHHQNEVLLTVKDTGPGIAADLLPHIFEAFITDKNTGTGLGLTISRDIIEQHFGRIEAENDPQGGAIFNIWLPAVKEGRA